MQQEALAPLANEWDTLSKTGQRNYIELARRYPSLTPVQKQRMHDRLEYWSKLTPAQRQRARQRYKALKKAAPGTRAPVGQPPGMQKGQNAAASAVPPIARP